MGRQPQRSATMPELAGGINLRDSVSMVRDNQLTDGLNIWHKDAVLKTRPGVKGLQSKFLFSDLADAAFDDVYMQPNATDIQRIINGKVYRLFTVNAGEGFDGRILFRFVAGDAIKELPGIFNADHLRDLGIQNYFVFEHKDCLYCFVFAGDVNEKECIVLRLNEEAEQWEELTKEDFYIPLVVINGDMHGVYQEPGGTMLEGHNLFTHRYRMRFNADTAEPDNTRYWILHKINMSIRDKLIGEKVIARLTDRNGEVVVHTVTIDANNPSVETTVGSDGLIMQVWEQGVLFAKPDGSGTPIPERYKGLHNNFEFELPFWDEEHEAAKTKVFRMIHSTWFGGKSAGLSGGTRLFLGGNTDEKEKNLVVWSDLNNPLYFPENNYFYVGNSSQAVTGFGKQNEMLVIFKERELFYTYYQQGKSYTAEDVIAQNVTDVTAASACFPLVQIHGSIGCDCPNSIQLCRNRLVWASTEGKVYTLATNNQYSERNVYEVSGMIGRRLEKETREALAGAFSCDWQGLYCLFVKNHVYLMDYNSYGYQYAYSYSKTEDSNVLIPWWYWEYPDTHENDPNIYVQNYCVYAVENSILMGWIKMIELDTEERGKVRYYFEEIYTMHQEIGEDTQYLHDTQTVPVGEMDVPEELAPKITRIPTMLQTKLFDFGLPQRNKAVPLVNIAFGSNGGAPIRVIYITENGEYPEEAVKLRYADTDGYTPGYVRNMPLRPCVGLINRFGIRMECEGNMAVDSVSIHYRITGGAK